MKEWYIRLKNQEEGPFTFLDLKQDSRLTPDTLVWKKGFPKWVAIRYVPELKELFEESQDSSQDNDNETKKFPSQLRRDDSVLAISLEPFHFWVWFFILFLVFLYALYKLQLAFFQ